ncbi:uncharacterized protein LOC127436607 [Myxocyprinus asiaticus]|uniref:uncharacterized protein LOC127436607 n=1 Tax=Myxocyprinus asiaticus TaxID=70543 RepID=UPI002223CCDF|nr:uncharacterized protein LOC127436607 [Myxocyprinus asiaticus]
MVRKASGSSSTPIFNSMGRGQGTAVVRGRCRGFLLGEEAPNDLPVLCLNSKDLMEVLFLILAEFKQSLLKEVDGTFTRGYPNLSEYGLVALIIQGDMSTPSPGNSVPDPSTGEKWISSKKHYEAPPYYFCFVRQAVLWNRGQHHTVVLRENGPPPLCSRFHAHMEACPVRYKPPHILSMHPRAGPNHLGQKQRRQTLSAPQTQTCPENGRQQYMRNSSRSQFAVVTPHVPASPNPIRVSPEPPTSASPTVQSVDYHQRFQSPKTPIREEDTRSAQADLNQGPHVMAEEELLTPSTLATPTTPSIPGTPNSPGTPTTPNSFVTPNSLSDFSRPASSQFSRSTDMNSSFSDALSVNFSDDVVADSGTHDKDSHANDHNQKIHDFPEGCSTSLPELHFSSPGSCGQASSQINSPQACLFKSLTSCKQETPSTCLPDTPIYTPKTLPQNPQSRQALDTQRSTDDTLHGHHRSSRSSLSVKSRQTDSSAAESRSEWNLWPVLPPIMPQQSELQGESVMEGTPFSQSSGSQSDIFAELDTLAPRTGSCVSPDHPAGSETDRSSPTADLSPGLAALTVGCDSGDLGSLSRVQLLLLARRGTESPGSVPRSPEWCYTPDREEYEPGLRVWSSGIPQYYQSTVLEDSKPLNGRNSKLCEGKDSLAALKGHRKHPGLISVERGSRISSSCSINSRISESSSRNGEKPTCENQGWELTDENDPIYWSPHSSSDLLTEGPAKEATILEQACPEMRDHTGEEQCRNRSIKLREKRKRKKENKKTEERKCKALQIYSKLQDGKDPTQATQQSPCSKFEDFDFLAKYCILSQEKLTVYKKAFEAADSDGDGYLTCLQVLLALKEIIPSELLTEEEEIYVYKILELVDFKVTEGLTDLRLFAVVASLAEKIAILDEFMRSLISKMDFRSLEMKLCKAKQLFLFLLEAQAGGAVAHQGYIEAEQLLVELKAGGIRPEHEESVRRELRNLRSLDLLDFLAHLPLFILIHNSVIANPFDDSSNL